MKFKVLDILGYLMFLGFMVVISPFLFITGGLVRIMRFYKYTNDTVNDKEPKQYYF